MAGGRGRHCALVGTGHIEQDEWELHRYEIDRSKCHDVAVENPDRLQEMIGLWWHEAGANNVLPRDDRAALQQVTIPPLTLRRPHDTYVYYPGTAAVPESQGSNIRGRSYSMLAEVELHSPDAHGVSDWSRDSAGTLSSSRTERPFTSITSWASPASSSSAPSRWAPAST
jgi:hypothetical protein